MFQPNRDQFSLEKNLTEEAETLRNRYLVLLQDAENNTDGTCDK